MSFICVFRCTRVVCSCLIGVWLVVLFFFFFKQKTAYEMRISDWSSDVCSSDLVPADLPRSLRRTQCQRETLPRSSFPGSTGRTRLQIGRASCRERVCQYV